MASQSNDSSTSALPPRKSTSSSAARKVNKAAKTGGGPHRKMQTPPSILLTLLLVVGLGSVSVWQSRTKSIEDARPRATITSGSGANRTIVRQGDTFTAAYGLYVCDARPADGAVPVVADAAATDPNATTTTAVAAAPGRSAVISRQAETTTTTPTDVSIAQTPDTTIVDPNATTTITIAPDPYQGNRQPGWVGAFQNNNANEDVSANGFYTKNAKANPSDSTYLPKGDGAIYATPFDDQDTGNTDDKNKLISPAGFPLEYVYSGRRAQLEAFWNTVGATITRDTIDLNAARLADGDTIAPDKKWVNGDPCPGDNKTGQVSSWVGELSKSEVAQMTKIKEQAVADRTGVLQSGDTEDVKKTRIAEIEAAAKAKVVDILNKIDLGEVTLEPNKLRMRDNAVFVVAFLPDGQEPPLPIDQLTALYATLPNSAVATDPAATTTTTVASTETTVATTIAP